MPDYDIAVIGSGFGGSLLSMIARRLGLSVLLVERGAHPRFAIGESTSPLTNLLLEQLAECYDLPALLPLTSYGPWQRTHPEIGCGLKRGFTYYQQCLGRPFRPHPARQSELMVAASPTDEVADTHWFRADVDHFLVRKAVEAGADYWDRTVITGLQRSAGNRWELTGEHDGASLNASTRLIVDASGPRGFLSQQLALGESAFHGYPATQALYSHFTGVGRCDEMEAYHQPGVPPYRPDDAALHHVFDGGWMWVLRFGNGITSAGVACTNSFARDMGWPCEGRIAWQRFLNRFPSIKEQFAEAVPVQPFVYAPRLSYRASQAAGPGWAMLPSAAAFIDPLFSTGFPLTLLGIERLAGILEETWDGEDLNARLCAYGAVILAEADNTAAFIAAHYAAMPCFPAFAALSMFYFAAASYSEMARRLDKRHLVTRYLAADRQDFQAGFARCKTLLPQVLVDPNPIALRAFEREVANGIACLNVAGLSDPGKQSWYGVNLADLVLNAEKLDMTPDAMSQVIATAPWAQSEGRI
jgi:tetracycline 7-halogenase / FADH2 O2-dependent halogenase